MDVVVLFAPEEHASYEAMTGWTPARDGRLRVHDYRGADLEGVAAADSAMPTFEGRPASFVVLVRPYTRATGRARPSWPGEDRVLRLLGRYPAAPLLLAALDQAGWPTQLYAPAVPLQNRFALWLPFEADVVVDALARFFVPGASPDHPGLHYSTTGRGGTT